MVISSTVYNEIPSEPIVTDRHRPSPTVIVVPIFDNDPDTGFGVELGDAQWAAPGLVTSLRKAVLDKLSRRVDIQALTAVNNMLVKILATPDR